MPSLFYKSAIVKPLLKKSTLDPNDKKNYRPVSNVSFISKILEKVVAYHLEETVVKRLAHWTPNQKVPGSNPAGGLNFRVPESALSTAP